MALSWATIQVLAGVPSVPEGETKNPQYRLHWEALPSSFSHFSPSLGLQTELNQQLHTPDAPIHRTRHILQWGQQAGAHVTEKLYTTMVFASFPPFLSRVPHPVSPHTPLSCPLLCPFFFLFSFWVQWTEPGNIYFALVVVNSSDRLSGSTQERVVFK